MYLFSCSYHSLVHVHVHVCHVRVCVLTHAIHCIWYSMYMIFLFNDWYVTHLITVQCDKVIYSMILRYHTNMHARTHTRARTHINVHTHRHIHTYIHTVHINTQEYNQIHIYIHTHTCMYTHNIYFACFCAESSFKLNLVNFL